MLFRDIVASQKAWSEVINQKLDVKVSFKLMKYVMLVEKEMELFNKQREMIIKEGSEEVEGGQVKIAKNEIDNINAKLNELASIESELPLFDMSIEELVDAIQLSDDNNISAGTLMVIAPFLKENEPDKEKPKTERPKKKV